MVSEDKIIKNSIRYSDNIFEIIKKKVIKDMEESEDLEEFLNRTREYTINNPLIVTGYQSTMTNFILQVLNDFEFQRASQRELVRMTIESYVGNLIADVGEDLQSSVRDIVKKGYDEGLHSHEVGRQLTQSIDEINHKRARTIARTEVSRSQNISEYIVNKEQGAIGFNVVCRPDCCPVCAEDYADVTDKSYRENYNRIQYLNQKLKNTSKRADKQIIRDDITGLEESQNKITGSDGGRLIGGNVQFTMDQTDMLPPRHPNCRCSANYVYR